MSASLRLVPVALLVLALAACGGGSKSVATTSTQTSTQASTQATETDASGCTAVTPPAGAKRNEPKPTQALDPSKTYDVNLQTNCGSFTIRLAVKTSPATTASFASLVRKHFFDGTIFHRIVPGFVVQGGDPTGTGQGGPGYQTVDKPPASTTYTLGVVAMAKTQAEAPGTSGSQFFVVTAQDAQLPPDYAVLGHISAGSAVVSRIGELGDQNTEQPTETVEIEHATLTVH
jgi:peptidyl-prolyl cis-trans isomerase B (cyclophilin B)